MDLGAAERPGIWQSVEPVARRANIVTLPDLPSRQQLVGDLEISPSVLTPNGDGINERAQIRFVVYKVEDAVPQVIIRDLAGRLVVELAAAPASIDQLFVWDGRDASGALVAPGIYVCTVGLGPTASGSPMLRAIGVAY